MEVSVRQQHVVVDEHERVVGGRVQLHRDRRLGVRQEVARCAVHLGRATERVRVLNLVAPAMGLDDRRALEELENVCGRRCLPGQRSRCMDLREEARPRALQRLDCQGARNVGGLRQTPGPRQTERTEGGHELRPVDEREPLLRLEGDRLEPYLGECCGAAHSLAVDPRFALADEREGEVRQGREVAARADRSPARNVRQDPAVQAFDQ